jgi:hypothetical protein
MAKKIQYRAISFEQAKAESLACALHGAQKLVVAIDVAKTKMMAGFGREDGTVVRLVKWTSPVDTRAFVELASLPGFAHARDIAEATNSWLSSRSCASSFVLCGMSRVAIPSTPTS